MRLPFSVLAFTGVALATIDFENWHRPGVGDVRGPCPCLNSLANHGIIPHSGKNLTIPVLVSALGEALNVSPEFATTISFLGTLTAADPSRGAFDLTDLNNHNVFEHDASLSRQDFNLGGDDHTFRPDIFADFIGHFDGMENVTLPVAAIARYDRVRSSRRKNPNFTYTVQHQITSYSETIFYFRTMVDPATGATPVKFVKILFEEERLPFREGWRTPTTQISGFSIASDVLQLALHTPEKYF